MSAKKKIALVEMVVYENMLPLIAGYLEAYARTDAEIDSNCEFEKLTWHMETKADVVLQELLARNADVYAFSTYMWNSVVTMQVARALARARPDSFIVLGGPQVMNYGDKYLEVDLPNMWIANGAGEIVFRDFLRSIVLDKQDLSTLKGASLVHDRRVISTGKAEDIHDLSTIPSPFLTGLFDDIKFSSTTFETNRGCPYTCTFCFFSKGDSTKLYKFETERVKDELTWMAKRSLTYLFMADANFGIFDRDVELVEHICKLREEVGRPRIVNFSAAKNKPERVSQITQAFHKAGVVISQPVSFQSLNDDTLVAIRRKNIKQEKYAALQVDLEEKGIPTMIELIWPLPGETVTTFKRGVDEFCRKRADTLSIYPLCLLNNTEMSTDRESFGAKTYDIPSETSEVEVVIETNTVSNAEYVGGLRLIYGLYALYNMRAFGSLCQYLDVKHDVRHSDLFADFTAFARARGNNDFALRTDRDIESYAYYYSFQALGGLAYSLLHEKRAGFLELLHDYAKSKPWWEDRTARALFDIDMVRLPYLYADSAMTSPEELAKYLSVVTVEAIVDRAYVVDVPDDVREVIRTYVGLRSEDAPGIRWAIDHRREQFRHKEGRSEQYHSEYCYGMVKRPNAIRPIQRLHGVEHSSVMPTAKKSLPIASSS